ncbi:MAG: carboxypeptidase-like regulatory domain-containing protein, partial [Prevotellaceae bacterium]|nr:carboxypeptidase-like regulatory domain-containing protein [Prevotellaceae bacterium]
MTHFYTLFSRIGLALRNARMLLPALMCMLCMQALAQSKITGKVIDDKGELMVGASVVVKGTTVGAMVGVDGTYSIVAAPDATLVASFVGYPNVEIFVDNRTTIDITLSTEGEALDEVVVVGYGTVKRANMLGAVASMKATDIQDIPVANLSTALKGRLAGVKVGQSSG